MTDTIWNLATNENIIGPSAKVVAAVKAAADGINRYPPFEDLALRESLAGYHGGVSAENIIVANSGSAVLDATTRALMRPGDEAILCTPAFLLYRRLLNFVNGVAIDVPLTAHGFRHDIESILAAVTPRTKILYLCNPHNPTGSLMSEAEMDVLLDQMPDHVVVVLDEVYRHFCNAPELPNSSKFVQEGRNLVAVTTFSKAFGLGGMRIGYGVAKPELAEKVNAAKLSFNIPSLSRVAVHTAVEDLEYVEGICAIIEDGKQTYYRECKRLGITTWPSGANFVMMQPGDYPAIKFAEEMEKRGIRILENSRDGLPGTLRVTIGPPEATAAFIAAAEEILAG